MVRSWLAPLVALVATSAGLAGCLDDDGPAPVVVEEPSPFSLAGQALRATPLVNGSAATSDDWFLLAVNATAEGGLAGFTWTVPPGSHVESQFVPNATTVALEVAPVVLDDDATFATAWGLFAFADDPDDEADGLVPLVSYVDATFQGTARNAPGQEDAGRAPVPKPFYLELGLGRASDGDVISFVLAARAEGEFAVAFRVVREALDFGAQATPDFGEFRVSFGNRTPFELQPVGVGTGFHAALYADTNTLLTEGVELWTDDLAIEESFPADPRPLATARDTLLASDAGFAAGWSALALSYFASQAAAGTWAANGELHGIPVERDGVFLQAPYGSSALFSLLGRPFLVMVADGEGPSTVALELKMANPNVVQSLFFQHVALGAPLTRLVGAAGAASELSFGGTLGGDLPPVRLFGRDGGLVLVQPDGSMNVLALA